MAVNNSWSTNVSMNDWMRDIEKRLINEERRPSTVPAEEVVGPGIGTYTRMVSDWNAEGPVANGFFYSYGDQVVNSPDDTKDWVGQVLADPDGHGFQQVWEYVENVTPSEDVTGNPVTSPTQYVRAFITLEDGSREYSPWTLGGGGGGGGGGIAGVIVQDENITIAAAATTLDFQGAGVSASGTGAEAVITVDGLPRGAAGGDLTGTYPNPTIAVNAVTPDKIADLPAVPANAGDPASKTYVDAQIAAIPAESTILTGSGPPAVATGAVGDFYIDTIGDDMYGPKGVGGYGPQQLLAIPLTPGNYTGSADYGTRVQFGKVGRVVGIRYQRVAANNATLGLRAWNDLGQKVAETSDTQTSGAGWFIKLFDTPLIVAAGSIYTFSYGATSGVPRLISTQTVGNTPDVTFLDFRNSAAANTYPNSVTASTTYHVEPVYEPDLDTWPLALETVPTSGASLAPVRVSTDQSGNLTLSGLQTIDGVTLVGGDRVLVTDQTTAAQNGIYVAQAGTWSRATDADSAAELAQGVTVYVREGTRNKWKVFTQLNVVTTVGTDALDWRVYTYVDTSNVFDFPAPRGWGHLFYNVNAKSLFAWDGAAWAMLNGVFVVTSTTRPTYPSKGNIVYETDTQKAYIYDGTTWNGFGQPEVYYQNTPVVNDAIGLNFFGAGVTVTNDGVGNANITIPGGGGGGAPTGPAGGDLSGTYPNPSLSTATVQALKPDVLDEGVNAALDVGFFNFKGAGVTATQESPGQAAITIPGTPTGAAGGDLSGTYPNPTLSTATVQAMRPDVQDEGVSVAADITVLNFKGAGVTATQASPGVADVTIPGGGAPVDPGWTDATYTNSWVTHATLPQRAQYKKIGNQVFVRGMVANGTLNASIFTLPVGLRPPVRTITSCVVSQIVTGAASTGTAHTHTIANTPCRLDIDIDGTVTTTGASTNTYVALAGVNFWVD